MAKSINAAVRRRAKGACEYCRMPQALYPTKAPTSRALMKSPARSFGFSIPCAFGVFVIFSWTGRTCSAELRLAGLAISGSDGGAASHAPSRGTKGLALRPRANAQLAHLRKPNPTGLTARAKPSWLLAHAQISPLFRLRGRAI